eukprot:m.71224 g.71224  ORF g.71224 m.71224 type:complete len:100 (+) comp12288_c0_seq2:1146-1445(+)
MTSATPTKQPHTTTQPLAPALDVGMMVLHETTKLVDLACVFRQLCGMAHSATNSYFRKRQYGGIQRDWDFVTVTTCERNAEQKTERSQRHSQKQTLMLN